MHKKITRALTGLLILAMLTELTGCGAETVAALTESAQTLYSGLAVVGSETETQSDQGQTEAVTPELSEPEAAPEEQTAEESPENTGLLGTISEMLGISESPTQGELWPEESSDIYYYYYGQLSDEEKSVYRCLLGNFLACTESFYVELEGEQGDYSDRIIEIASLVLADHPEIFWVSGSFQWQQWPGGKMLLTPEYTCTGQALADRQAELETAVQQAATEIMAQEPEGLYGMVKAVFQYVIDTVDYDVNAPDNQNVCSALLNGSSVCAGYAEETLWLLQRLGFQALTVTGSADGGPHAWNMVCIDGQWYQLDTTFGERAFEDEAEETVLTDGMQYDYAYLCCTDRLMDRDHSPDNPELLPECTDESLNFFALSGSLYESSDAATEALTQTLYRGDEGFRAQFSGAEAYNDFLALLQDEQELLELMGRAGVMSLRICTIPNEMMTAVDIVLQYG